MWEYKSERLIILQIISTPWTSFDMQTEKDLQVSLVHCTWQVTLEVYEFELSNFIFQWRLKNNEIAEGITLSAQG